MDDQTAFPPDAVHLSLDGFEGPLDLLLELACISITTLVDQYLLAVADAERFDLMRAADWLAMAAWLTWLKSRSLLPMEAEKARVHGSSTSCGTLHPELAGSIIRQFRHSCHSTDCRDTSPRTSQRRRHAI